MAKPRKLLGTVEEAEAAFYDALGRADIEALMSLWADEEEIVCIHPGAPRLVGYASIRASWEAIFEHGGVLIRPVQLRATQNLMLAVHSVVEEIQRAKSERQDIHILATNVFLKTPLGWRIVAHHASVAPGAAEPEPAAGTTLH
jgi:ketosteroid isomerase-like protein